MNIHSIDSSLLSVPCRYVDTMLRVIGAEGTIHDLNPAQPFSS